MEIKIELLSDMCASSGVGQMSIVDSEVCFDEIGLPFIPAKRIKGILRECMRDVLEAKGTNDIEICNTLGNWFGNSINAQSSKLNISNANIENYSNLYKEIKFKLKSKDKDKVFLNKYKILANFTYCRSQTSIENGVGKNKSLRTIRVLKKGLIFDAAIEIEKPHEDFELFKQTLKAFRFIGSNRTRGLGLVKVTLDSKKSIMEHGKEICGINNNYVGVRIKLLDDTILGNEKNISEESLDYIRGNAVLGAFASNFIKTNNLCVRDAHQNKEFKSIFLDGDIIFSNFYISTEDFKKRTIPTPFNIFSDKNKEILVINKDKDYTNYLGGYSFIENNAVYKSSPKKVLNYHHRRAQDRSIGHSLEKRDDDSVERTGTLFSYEALKNGQEFLGYFFGNKETINKVMETIQAESIVRIGKSKSSQYSRAIISYETYKPDNYCIYNSSGENTYIVLSSDLILPSFGSTKRDMIYDLIEEELKKKELIIKIDKENSIFKLGNTKGFNAKWSLPKQSNIVIKAGSVFKIDDNTDEEIDLKSTNKFLNIGVSTNEGYGEIMILSYDEDIFLKDCEEDINSKHTQADHLIKIMNEVKSRELMSSIRYIAKKRAENDNDKCEIYNTSTVGKLKYALEELKYTKTDKFLMEVFGEKLEQIKGDKKGREFYKEYLVDKDIFLRVLDEDIFNSNDSADWGDEFKTGIVKNRQLQDANKEFINKLQYEFLIMFLNQIRFLLCKKGEN